MQLVGFCCGDSASGNSVGYTSPGEPMGWSREAVSRRTPMGWGAAAANGWCCRPPLGFRFGGWGGSVLLALKLESSGFELPMLSWGNLRQRQSLTCCVGACFRVAVSFRVAVCFTVAVSFRGAVCFSALAVSFKFAWSQQLFQAALCVQRTPLYTRQRMHVRVQRNGHGLLAVFFQLSACWLLLAAAGCCWLLSCCRVAAGCCKLLLAAAGC